MKQCRLQKGFFLSIAHVIFFLVVLVLAFGDLYPQEVKKVSKFGEYLGYSQEVFDSWIRRIFWQLGWDLGLTRLEILISRRKNSAFFSQNITVSSITG